MNSIDFEVLDLSNFDPLGDIVIAYVDIGKMPPQRAKKYLEDVRNRMGPKFEERGFDVIYVARNRDGVTSSSFTVASKEAAKANFDESMSVIG